MINKHERGIPSKYLKSTSTKARHDAKLYSLLDWIYRFGFTSTSVIELLWDVERSVVNRMVKRYVDDGVLNEVATFACRDRRVFLLKPKAIRMLEELHGEELRYSIKPSTINPKSITHDLIVGCVIAFGLQQGKIGFFITEREQQKDNQGKRRRVDAICYDLHDNEMVAVEVECSAKTIPHRLDLLRRYRKAISDDNLYHKVLIYSHKRRYVKDAERVNSKLTSKEANQLDEMFFKEHIKYIYNKELIALIYNKFWLH
ncbi:MarR family transcriptional regulator [Thalassotalea sp. ND16A]|uniref:MarR family transcriptional regulator n=1 Tax=Thalassotalea sp. ND16A TaxID=1535422 RepID=UPI00051A087B|nr:MarR family transcriptional regulator [Thalassotalea sp. ND16A]KGJ99887.1 hypothetical protein ND16A_3675 [Thalassotalea sp. ND16A]